MKAINEKDREDLVRLVERIKEGDESAEAELYNRYRRGLFIIIKQASNGSSLSEDFLHETFKITLTRIRKGELHDPGSLSSFIRRVAINVVTTHYRKPTQESLDDADKHFNIADSSLGPLEQLLQKEKSEIVRQVLSSLKSDRDREVLYRFFVAEEDKAEICADLGLTHSQFNVVLFRAREHYRKLFDKIAGNLRV